MKYSIFTLFLLLLAAFMGNEALAQRARPAKITGIVPQPQSIEPLDGKGFLVDNQTVIVARSKPERKIAQLLQQHLVANGITLRLAKKVKKNQKNIVFSTKNKAIAHPEGYLLRVKEQQIELSAGQPAGLFYGLQTLLQLLPLPGEMPVVRACEIQDEPRFAWRGLHLDVSRHFFKPDFVKKLIDVAAFYKINTFHWHLTDDQGWRLEIKKYPKLCSVGAMRKETQFEKQRNPFKGDGQPHGGYYTQAEVREVVEYARQRFVTVVPEIEMPGHSLAALAAYPAMSCQGKPLEVGMRWGGFDDVFCSKDSVFQFIDDILEEVCALFPSQYIHIGGDEVSKTRWNACPVCQKTMQREGLKNTFELQSYFIRRVEKMLQKRGKQLLGWDEILEGGLAPDATVMSWRGESGGIASAKAGHDVIMSPGFALYFDFYQGDPAQEPLAICCFSDLRKVYDYNPVPAELDEQERQRVIGCQANIWTEYIRTDAQAEYMAFPRTLALAEIAWTKPEQKDFEHFLDNLSNHWPRLDAWKVNYRVPTPGGLYSQMTTQAETRIAFDFEMRPSAVHFTTDDTDVTERSPATRVAAPVSAQTITLAPGEKRTVKARTYSQNGRASVPVAVTLERLAAPLSGMAERQRLLSGLSSRIWDGHFSALAELPSDGGNERILNEARPPLDVNYLANWGIDVNGFLRIETPGTYLFSIISADMLEVKVDGQTILSQSATPAAADTLSQSIELTVGLHPIKIKGIGAGFKRRHPLLWQRPDAVKLEGIPAEVLYRAEEK